MKIEVFSPNCCSCNTFYDVVQQAVNQSGISAEVVKVDDMIEIIKRGIMRTPGLVIDAKVVCAGRTPKLEEIMAWLAGSNS